MTGVSDQAGSTLAPDSPLSLRGQVAVVTGAREAVYVRVDVSSADSVARAFSEVEHRAGRVEFLVNCARIRDIKQVGDLEPTEWDRVVAVNLSGTFYCAREAAQRTRATQRGAIVNVASVAGLVRVTYRPAYTASKHGIVGLAKNLATDLAPMGVRVNAVAPGTIRTPPTEAYFSAASFLAGVKATVPLGATMFPLDIRRPPGEPAGRPASCGS